MAVTKSLPAFGIDVIIVSVCSKAFDSLALMI